MAAFLKNVFSRNRKKGTDEEFEYSRSNYDETFFIPKKILRWVTIQMTHDVTPFASKYWDWFYWFEFVNLSICLVLEIISMAETARGGSFDDAVKIFRMMPCSGMVLLGLAKSFSMVHHRPVYENIINELGDMWSSRKVDEHERAVIVKARNQLLFVIKGYYWCNNALLISFLSPPIIEVIKRLLGYESEMITHFFYWLPFDPYQPVYIDILVVLQTWQALVVIWCNLCGDLLLFAFLSHITTQFDLLSIRIQNLFYVPIDSQMIESYPLSVFSKEHLLHEGNSGFLNDVNSETKLQKDLTEIILRHKTLIRLSKDVEDMFTFALLMNFLNSSVIICFCGFCSVVVEKWNDIAYKSFLLTALSQTFLICWYGQKLLDSSKGVSTALYNSGWYKGPQKIKSPILIMLCRSQKQVCITTYGYSVISLKSYTNIIKTAWSYFTILLNTYKQ